MSPLTATQKRLDRIRILQVMVDRPPMLALDICDLVNAAPASAAFAGLPDVNRRSIPGKLDGLHQQGYVRWAPGKQRASMRSDPGPRLWSITQTGVQHAQSLPGVQTLEDQPRSDETVVALQAQVGIYRRALTAIAAGQGGFPDHVAADALKAGAAAAPRQERGPA